MVKSTQECKGKKKTAFNNRPVIKWQILEYFRFQPFQADLTNG
jgi:hypothetical protein